MENKLIKGRKGGSSQSRTPVEQPDDLQSVARAKLLLALGEGEFAGELNAQTIFLDGTPLENADGTKNFSGVSWEFRPGSQSQSYIQGMPGSENEINAGIEISSTQAWTHTFTNTQLSAIRLRLKWPSLFKQEDNGDLLGNSVKYLIELQTDGGTWQSVVDSAVTGKTTSGYERCHRIDLPAAQTSWTLRLRKISVDANSAKIGDKMSLESYTEVIDAKLSYPNTALLYIEFDSSQFGGSIPQIACEPRGRVIRVPDNYDPETRSYSGIWSGTFKWAWSDNPAWVFYDLVVNDRFGLGHRLSAANIDKWMLYQVAQYCDQPVPDGKGGDGTEPRYVCNIYIQDRNEAYTVLRDIAAIFRGMTYSGGDQIVCMADMPRDIDFNYTRANVLDGKFVYSSSTSKSRYTSALVSWSDPDNAYSDAMEPVFEKDLVARYGFNQLEVTAIGCTRQSEANRKGRWAILTNNKDRVVTFSVGLDGNIPQPGYIITVADELLSGKVNGGRIRAVEGRVITLDRIPDASVGDRLIVNLPSGVSQSRSIAAIDDSTITVTAGYSESPEPEGVWVVESGTLYAQQYRVVSVADNNDGTFTISAASHDPDKYARIDTGVVIDQRPVSVIPPGNQAAPQEIVIETFSVVNQGIHVDHMRVNWSPAANAVAYEAQWRRDNGNWVNVPRGSTTSFEVSGVYAGRYLVRVRAINAAEISSGWAYSQETTLAGKVGKPAAIAGLTASADIVFGINLNWGFGQGTADGLKTSLYVSGSADLADETLLADVPYPQNSYAITGLAAGVRRWFRAVFSDKSGNRSDYCNAVIGQASTDAEEITSYLTGKITETELGQELLAEIGGKVTQGDIDDAISGVQNSLNDVQQTVDNAIQETQKALDDTQKSIADTEASLQESISQTEQLVAEARAQAEALAADAQAQAQQALDLAQSQFNDALVQEARERTEAIADEARARADAILNEKNERVAAIENTRTIVQSNYDSLAQMISQVSAGTGEQFDSAKIWYFDKGIEGWNGAANPDVPGWVEGGWIRPADKTPAAVASPNDLAIDGDKYNFIKLRVKKVGNPRWAGKLWTLSPQVTGWENARTLNFPEPDYDVDGVATFNIADVPSEGVIRRFRIDLAAAQTENDYFLIDYIATGRPAPGASVGMVEEERTARANADAAQAAARETLATQLRGGYTGNDVNQVSAGLIYSERQARVAADRAEATARQALETKVDDSVSGIQQELSTLNSTQLAQASEITGLTSELNNKAQASALQSLSTRVTAAEGSLNSQSGQLTSLSNSLQNVVNDNKALSKAPGNMLNNPSFERDLDSWTRSQTASNAWSILAAQSPMTGSKIAQYQSPGSTALSGNNRQLIQNVTLAAGKTYRLSCYYRHEPSSTLDERDNHKLRLGSSSALVNAVEFDVAKTVWTLISVDWKCSASGAYSVGLYGSLKTGRLYIDDIALIDISAEVGVAANASAISGLNTKVTSAEGSIASQGAAITQLNNNLAATNSSVSNKADAAALNALTSRVTSAEGKITSQGSAITSLNSDVSHLSNMGESLVVNGQFDSGTQFWRLLAGGTGNTITWSATGGDGRPGVVIKKGSTTSNPQFTTGNLAGSATTYFPTQPGRSFRVHVRARGVSGAMKMLLRLVSRAENGTESYNQQFVTLTTSWQNMDVVLKTTTVAKSARLAIYAFTGSDAELTELALDSVSLYDITDATEITAQAAAVNSLTTRVSDVESRADSVTTLSARLQRSGGNVFPDGTFETYSVGDVINGQGRAVVVNGPVHQGSRALRLRRGAGTTGNGDASLTPIMTVRPGAVFAVEAMIYASGIPATGANFILGMQFADETNSSSRVWTWIDAINATVSRGTIANGKWLKVSGYCRCPVDTDARKYRGGSVWASLRDNAQASGGQWDVFVDNLVVREVTEGYNAQVSADSNASAISGLTTRVTGIEATAASITQLNAAIQDISNQGDSITPNPRFLNGLTGWQTSGNVARRPADGENGGACAALVNSGTAVNAQISTTYLPVTGARQYRMTVRIKANSGTINLLLRRRWKRGNISAVDMVGDNATSVSTSWVTYTWDFTASPDDTAYARFDLINTSVNSTLLVDTVLVFDITDTLANNAQASAISTLQTKVANVEGNITSQASQLTSLDANVSGLLKGQGQQGESLTPDPRFAVGISGYSSRDSGWEAAGGEHGRPQARLSTVAKGSNAFLKTALILQSRPPRRYRILVRARLSSASASAGVSNKILKMRLCASSNGVAESGYNVDNDVTLSDAFQSFTWEVVSNANYRYFSFQIFNMADPSATKVILIDTFQVFDITDAYENSANASATSALTARVTAAEGKLDSQSTSITQLQNNLNGKADASALNALSSRVTSAEGKLETQSQSITQVRSALDTHSQDGVCLNANPTFKGGMSYWGRSGSVVWSATSGEGGTAGVTMIKSDTINPVIRTNCSVDGSANGTFEFYPLQNAAGSNIGRPLAVRVRAKGVSGAMNLMVRFIEYANDGSNSYANDKTLTFTSGWSTQTAKFTAKTTTTRGRIEVFCYPANASVAITSVNVEDDTANKAQADGSATASALSSLTSRVTDTEGKITSTSSSLTSLTNRVDNVINDGKAAAKVPANGVVNPSFEFDLDGWVREQPASNCWTVINAANPVTGRKIAQYLSPGTTAGSSNSRQLTQNVAMVAGCSYRISCMYRHEASSTLDAQDHHKLRLGNGATFISAANFIVANTAWTRLSFDYTCPASGNYNIGLYGSLKSGRLYIDDVAVVEITGEIKATANASAIQGLDTRITTAEKTVTSQGSAITQLRNDLTTTNSNVSKKAEATALTALTNRVTRVEGQTTAQANQTTQLSATLDDAVNAIRDVANDTRNMIINGSFENDFKSWYGTSGVSVNASGRSGKCAMNTNTADGSLSQRIYLTKDRTYRLSCWCKFNSGSVAKWDNTKLRIGFTNGAQWAEKALANSTIATDWVYTYLDVKPTSSQYMAVGVNLAISTGGCRIDDVRFEDVTDLLELNKKADSSALTALTTRVSEAEGKISSQASSITSLSSSLSNMAGDLDAIASGTGDSLTPNPRFINGIGGWQKGNGTFTWSASSGSGGVPGVTIVSAANNNAYIGTQLIPVAPGRQYRFILRAKHVNGSNTTLKLRQVNGTSLSGGTLTNRDADYTLTTTWQTITRDFVASSATTACAQFRIFNMGASSGNTTIVVDTFAVYDVTDMLANQATASALDLLSTRVTSVEAEAEEISSLSAEIDKHSASIQKHASAISTLDGKVSASWTLKVETDSKGNKVVAGIGLGADASGNSQFLVNAQRFAMISANNGTVSTPFAVENGQTFINSAFIKDGAITNAKISGRLESNNFKSGVSGWAINKDTNGCEFNNVVARGAIYASAGIFNNVTIEENCDVKGVVYAKKIVGDIVDVKNIPSGGRVKIEAVSWDRTIFCLPMTAVATWYQLMSAGGIVQHSGRFYCSVVAQMSTENKMLATLSGAASQNNPLVSSSGGGEVFVIPANEVVNVNYERTITSPASSPNQAIIMITKK